MSTPLEKAIQAAYEYHPYGMGLSRAVGWTVGPTFMVRKEGEPLLDLAQGSSSLARMVNSILETASEAIREVSIVKEGHTKEQRFRTDKYGAQHPLTPGKCTGRAIVDLAREEFTGTEMPFPLLRLAKQLRPTQYTVKEENAALVHAWREDALVGVFQARLCVGCVMDRVIREAA